uniref:Uncharacterized protein n=1 Tax=Cacopsylla melanoneura TaxID=428564 RepID=A0A8D9F8L3_9HEMI
MFPLQKDEVMQKCKCTTILCNTIFSSSLAMFWCQTINHVNKVADSFLRHGNFFYDKAKLSGTLLVIHTYLNSYIFCKYLCIFNYLVFFIIICLLLCLFPPPFFFLANFFKTGERGRRSKLPPPPHKFG